MPWNPETGAFDPPTGGEWPITLEPDPPTPRTVVPMDVACLGLALLIGATTVFLVVPWTRTPLLTTLGIVAILAGCGVVRSVLERRRPDSSLVDALRRWGL